MKLVVCLLLSIAVGFVAAEVELGRMGTMSPADMGEFVSSVLTHEDHINYSSEGIRPSMNILNIVYFVIF
jgi:hypothetical protein